MKEVNVNIGGGFLLLTILFVILKVTGYIAWSWWWVFAPMWIPWLIFIGIAVLFVVGCLFALLIFTLFGIFRD